MRVLKRQIFMVPALFLLAALAVHGQIAKNTDTTPEKSPPKQAVQFSDLNDLIHFGDLINVDVVGSSEFDWRGEVTPEGTLGGLGFTVEPIPALCRPGADVARAIEREYSKFLNSPQIKVEILDRSKRPLATLFGAVRFPQRYRLLKNVSLKELLVISGGFLESADGEIEIIRQPSAACVGFSVPGDANAVGDEQENAVLAETEYRSIKIDDILKGDPDANPTIFYGDLLTVKSAPPVYVIGNVKRPGKIALSTGLTVNRAIAAAGGVPEKNRDVEIRIFRRNAGKTEIIEFTKTGDGAPVPEEFEVRKYDIVEVYGGRGKRLNYPPVLQNSEQDIKGINELPIRVIN